MLIEVWSDVVCPWCYIGKRRLEEALAGFAVARPDEQVEVVWRSFQLDPGASATPAPEPMAERLGRKYGGGPQAGQQMIDQMEAVAAEEGLLYRLGQARQVSTRDAHRLLHAAREVSTDLQGRLKERLLAAYMVEGLDVADHEQLVALGAEVGLDPDVARRVLAEGTHGEAVEEDLEQALAYGVSGVPFFVVDRRFGVAGAQPAAVLQQTLERAWAESHPVLEMAPASGDSGAAPGACGPDGCAI